MRADLKRFVEWIKERTPCKDCRQIHHYAVMEFDHVPDRGEKLGTIGQFVDADDEPGLCDEIDKCDIVCVICHRYRTLRRGLSEETRKKMSAARKGKKLSKSHRAKISKFQRTRVVSDETKRKMSLAQMGNTKTKGKKFPDRRRPITTGK